MAATSKGIAVPDQGHLGAPGPGSVSSSEGGELGRHPAIPPPTTRLPTRLSNPTTPTDHLLDLMDTGSMQQPRSRRSPGTAAPPAQSLPSTSTLHPRRSERLPRRSVHPTDLHSILAPSSWSRYVSLRPDEGSQVCALHTYRSLKEKFPQDTPDFHVADSRMEVVVHATSESRSKELLGLKSLGSVPVISTDKNEFNKRTCTVLVHQFLPGPGASDDFIAATIGEVFADQGHTVDSVVVFEKASFRSQAPVKVAKLTLHQQTLPPFIRFAGSRIRVQEELPTPLHCSVCLRFGHSAKICKSTVPLCFKCGLPDHDPLSCPHPLRCLNCGGPHHARNRKCPHYLYHQEIRIRSLRSGISKRQAKLDMRAEGLALGAPSFASVVAASGAPRPAASSSLPDRPPLPSGVVPSPSSSIAPPPVPRVCPSSSPKVPCVASPSGGASASVARLPSLPRDSRCSGTTSPRRLRPLSPVVHVLPLDAPDSFHTPPRGHTRRRRPRKQSFASPAQSSTSSSRTPKRSRRGLSDHISDLSLSSGSLTAPFIPEDSTGLSPSLSSPSPTAVACSPPVLQTVPDEVERSLAALHGVEPLSLPSRRTVPLSDVVSAPALPLDVPSSSCLSTLPASPARASPTRASPTRLSLMTDCPLPPGTTPEDLLSQGRPPPSPPSVGSTPLAASSPPSVLGAVFSDPPPSSGPPDPP